MGDFPLCNSCYSLLCLFLILMCFLKKWWQDFVSDLSPEETVRRMQKGRVGGSTDLLIVAIALESHFNKLWISKCLVNFAVSTGVLTGEVPLPPRQTFASGGSSCSLWWQCHHCCEHHMTNDIIISYRKLEKLCC